jgi:hypothetical protein
MALLFVLFPRIGPLWGVPQDGISTTGLSNSMKLGSVAEVAQDDAIALRMRFDGTPPLPQSMYLRGTGAVALRRHRVAPGDAASGRAAGDVARDGREPARQRPAAALRDHA